jgi:predicted DNA-binding ribbon-helix-helix protein
MTRTQIQLPEPLFNQLRKIAQVRDISLAELIRRGMEIYALSCPELTSQSTAWQMPVLRKSGGHRVDPATVRVEAAAIESRFQKH